MKILLFVGAVALVFAQTAGNSENGRRLYVKDGSFEMTRVRRPGWRRRTADRGDIIERASFDPVRARPFGAMPAFTQKVLPDPELADIYTYLKSLPAKPTKDIPLLKQLQ